MACGALLIAVLLICLSTGEWRTWLRRVSAGVAGAAAASAALLVYLAAVGALGRFVAAYFGFNFMYVGTHTVADRVSSIGYGAGQLGYLVFAAVVVAWVLTLRRVLRRQGERTDGDVLAPDCRLAPCRGRARGHIRLIWSAPCQVSVPGPPSRGEGNMSSSCKDAAVSAPGCVEARSG